MIENLQGTKRASSSMPTAGLQAPGSQGLTDTSSPGLPSETPGSKEPGGLPETGT